MGQGSSTPTRPTVEFILFRRAIYIFGHMSYQLDIFRKKYLYNIYICKYKYIMECQ